MGPGTRHFTAGLAAGSSCCGGGPRAGTPMGHFESDLPASPLGADGYKGSVWSHGGEPKALMSTL